MRKHLAIAFAAWAALTVLGLALLIAVYAARGNRGIEFLLPRGAWTYSPLILLTAAMAWVLGGCALLIGWREPPRREHLVFFIGFLLLAFLYLNLLREREHFYDLHDYIVAAQALNAGRPLPPRYLYPPLWAICLAPLAPLGKPALGCLLHAANFATLLLFFTLVCRALHRGGFTFNGAALAAFLLLAVNVPLLRTIYYGQVNLHVACLILLALLWSARRPALSAAALALAAHLKIIPVIFVIPFLFARNGRWLAWFTVVAAAIALGTRWAGGAGVYHDFLANTRAALATASATNFRDNSLDSLIHATAYILRHLGNVSIPPSAVGMMIIAMKSIILCCGLWLMNKVAKQNSFGTDYGENNFSHKNSHTSQKDNTYYYNSFIVISFLMLLLSPVGWEHYPVWLVFPFLAMLRPLASGGELTAWLCAWFLIFCVPTFDFYPFSYTRLAGIGICCVLLFRCARRPPAEGPALRFLNRAAAAMTRGEI